MARCRCALLELPYVAVETILSPDPMHTIAGVSKDLTKCMQVNCSLLYLDCHITYLILKFFYTLQDLRVTPAILQYEQSIRRLDCKKPKHSTSRKNHHPWALSEEDRNRVKKALVDVQAQVSSRLMGSRFTALFSSSKRPRSHHYFMFASPYGKSTKRLMFSNF